MKNNAKFKKYTAITLAALTAAAMLPGCGSSSSSDSASDASSASSAASSASSASDASSASSTAASTAGGYKIGITISDLTNTVWAELCKEATSYAKENYDSEVTVVSFEGDPSKQVTQIENFVASGYDAIIVCPDDPDSVEDACKNAMDAGVRICCYSAQMENQDFDYVCAEYDTGYEMGQACADWIESNDILKDQDKIEIGILNYRVIPTVIERENGFEDAVNERMDNAEVVIRQQCISELEGTEGAETFFQAYPDLDVIYSISGAGALGALEAANAAGKIADDFGVFCVDFTEDVAKAVQENNGLRAAISLGGGKTHAHDMIDYLMILLNGGEVGTDVEFHNPLPITRITTENVEEEAAKEGYSLD